MISVAIVENVRRMTRRISGLSSTIIKHIGVISFGEIIGLERPRENRHALPISYGWGAPFSWVGVPIWIAECDPLAYASGSELEVSARNRSRKRVGSSSGQLGLVGDGEPDQGVEPVQVELLADVRAVM